MNPYTVCSMTAFGAAEASCPQGSMRVEVQSVNRRHLEITVHLPPLWASEECRVRQYVKQACFRGAVSVRVLWQPLPTQEECILPNIERVRGYQKAWLEIAHSLNLPTNIPIEWLLREKEIFSLAPQTLPDRATLLDSVVPCALQRLVEMKREEGQSLAAVLTKHCLTLETYLEKIQTLLPLQKKYYEEKLQTHLASLPIREEEARDYFLSCILPSLEKMDISEEIARIESHIQQIRSHLVSPSGEGRGKTLEFLIQELLREANTLCAKSAEIQVTYHGVNMKAEIEKMREQVQNIE